MAQEDFLYVDVLGDRNLLRNLDQMPEVVRTILSDKVNSWTHKLADAVRANIEQKLKQRTGKLAAAVNTEVTEDSARVDGRVFVSGVPYARAQEEGATTPPHMIYPNKGRVLAFTGSMGDKVFATRVSHPGGHIPAAYFMKDAYREMGPQISKGIKKAVIEGVRAHMRSSV